MRNINKAYRARFSRDAKIITREKIPARVSLIQIVVDLPDVFFKGANSVDNAYILRAMLDGLIEVNQAYLRRYHATPSLYESGVIYGRTQQWDSIPALYARGFGDCKTLTAADIAEERNKGVPTIPVFRLNYLSEGILFHILVQRPNGWKDPSKILGMNKHESAYI